MAYGLFPRGTASHTGNLRIFLKTMSSPKFLSLSENIFVRSLSSLLMHKLLDTWVLHLFAEELLVAHMMKYMVQLHLFKCISLTRFQYPLMFFVQQISQWLRDG